MMKYVTFMRVELVELAVLGCIKGGGLIALRNSGFGNIGAGLAREDPSCFPPAAADGSLALPTSIKSVIVLVGEEDAFVSVAWI